jgi:hypothetical protein
MIASAPLPSRKRICICLMYLTLWISTRNHVFPDPLIDEHSDALSDGIPSIESSEGWLEADPLDTIVAWFVDKSRSRAYAKSKNEQHSVTSRFKTLEAYLRKGRKTFSIDRMN